MLAKFYFIFITITTVIFTHMPQLITTLLKRHTFTKQGAAQHFEPLKRCSDSI